MSDIIGRTELLLDTNNRDNKKKKKDILIDVQQELQHLEKFKPEEIQRVFDILSSTENVNDCATILKPGVFYDVGMYLLQKGNREIVYNYLDIFKSPNFLKKIYDDNKWEKLILDLIVSFNYTFPQLFKKRVQKYSQKTIFTILKGNNQKDYSFANIDQKVKNIAKGLLALGGHDKDFRVAFYCSNSLEMVLCDLACLIYKIVNIMIPANAVVSHLQYILDKTKPTVLIISGKSRYDNIKDIGTGMNYPGHVILLSDLDKKDKESYEIKDVIEIGRQISDDKLEKRAEATNIKELATMMFTSGTTGNPKGIMFSQKNIVYKRFCRAMALPEIGDSDRFLCYLPLFHTFGRWFEMTGTIFWNAQYIFMENPAIETMIRNMKKMKPTVFISIPKKWFQLYELVAKEIDIEHGDENKIRNIVHKLTGSQLKWGLSAAGHLDSDIFIFFQRNGIELMSGFGMTEATGGITMTPPGKYKANSLGKALPGIELKIADDGELLIRGPYVMIDYFNPEESESYFIDGWLQTGDIMEMDSNGFIRIIDRKKEIYKNIKGETIAPQKIENYFREFDFIKHVFLVGDHRPYNTLLIYPNYESTQMNLTNMGKDEIRDYFSSVVVSVNRFLSPFERIVNFKIIERDFDAEKGELTPKGTYRRSTIEENFQHDIQPMYENNYISKLCDDIELRIPTWFLREKGITANEISYDRNSVFLESARYGLPVEKHNDLIRIGQFLYKCERKQCIDFGKILSNPMLWLGNETLVNFTGDNIFRWFRREKIDDIIKFQSIYFHYQIEDDIKEQLIRLFEKKENSLVGMHISALLLNSRDFDDAGLAINYLERIIKEEKSALESIALELLRRSSGFASLDIRREVFRKIITLSADEDFYADLLRFLEREKKFIDTDVLNFVTTISISLGKLKSIYDVALSFAEKSDERAIPLMIMLSKYGKKRPTRFKLIRRYFVRIQRSTQNKRIAETALKARLSLRSGFREWLGVNQQFAVDVETGEEYSWKDVITFEDDIDKDDRQKIMRVIEFTAFIREAVFLFSNNVQIGLDDIPPGGIWISFLGEKHGKAVYRITVQTRFRGSYDLAINLNKIMKKDDIFEEIEWLILSGTPEGGKKLVEDFGGYWDDFDLWSEEFIPGETVGKFLRRLTRLNPEQNTERLQLLWPYFIWSAAAAYFSFWQRTGSKMEIHEPSVENIIIPDHDYQTGSRIVSISSRSNHKNILDMLLNFNASFVKVTHGNFDFLKQENTWYLIFSAFIEVAGTSQGYKLLEKSRNLAKKRKQNEVLKKYLEELDTFLNMLKLEGFIPKSLYFAIKRYNRWISLNKKATAEARVMTLSELFETYTLDRLEENFPETRTLFYYKTVFVHSNTEIKEALMEIINETRKYGFNPGKQIQQFTRIRNRIVLSKDESFFLMRLIYPHLRPDDSAQILQHERGGESRTNLVVQIQDYDGNLFSIRSPINPKEIAKLHQLFLRSKLNVQFRPDHRYLITVNERGTLVGGLFYKRTDEKTVHLEKVVVDEHYRKKGISDAMLNELFKRLKTRHTEFITTGFFRPEYFYRFDFKIEKKYAGLVKKI